MILRVSFSHDGVCVCVCATELFELPTGQLAYALCFTGPLTQVLSHTDCQTGADRAGVAVSDWELCHVMNSHAVD